MGGGSGQHYSTTLAPTILRLHSLRPLICVRIIMQLFSICWSKSVLCIQDDFANGRDYQVRAIILDRVAALEYHRVSCSAGYMPHPNPVFGSTQRWVWAEKNTRNDDSATTSCLVRIACSMRVFMKCAAKKIGRASCRERV